MNIWTAIGMGLGSFVGTLLAYWYRDLRNRGFRVRDILRGIRT